MFIYVLKDPDSGEVRYVGKTNNPKKRMSGHLSAQQGRNLPSIRWVRKLKNLNKFPVMEIIEETDDWENSEKKWICHYRNVASDLLNIDDGGIVSVYSHSASGARKSKKYMSVVHKISYGLKLSISKESKEYWSLLKKTIIKTRKFVYESFGKDGIEYFDDCIYSEFIERNPQSFRILI